MHLDHLGVRSVTKNCGVTRVTSKIREHVNFVWNLLLYLIGHVRYINIQAWLRGFRVKIANFSSFFCLSIPKGDLDTKKTTPNIDVRPESLGSMLEY